MRKDLLVLSLLGIVLSPVIASAQIGACCLDDGSCQDVTEAECETLNGFFWFPDVSCEDNLCPDPDCVVEDTDGTVNLPPVGCEYLSPQQVHLIIEGLPDTTTIELGAIHKDFLEEAKGNDKVGAQEFEFFASTMYLVLRGTGALEGWVRDVSIYGWCTVVTDPYTHGDPVQAFDAEMTYLNGELYGYDPDFDQLVITGGSDYGLPSPGHTVLTQLPTGDWNVDSFFDVRYRIEFTGAEGGMLEGLSGATTGTVHMETGEVLQSGACCFGHEGECIVSGQAWCEEVQGGYIWIEGVDCDPNPCPPTAIEQTTWGRIRTTYR